MLTDIVEIMTDVYMDALRFNIRTGGNLMVFGQAGTGKTECALQAVAESEYQGVYLNLSVLEAPDLIGLPIIVDGVVEYASPKMLPRKDRHPKMCVLVVDEIDKAKPELQNPLLELFQFRSVCGTELSIHAIIATGNLPDEGAFSQPVSHALTNRCKVYKVSHSFEAWRDWAQNTGLNPLVIGFLSKNQEFLSRKSVEGDPTAYCRPSPRSWASAARDLDATTNRDTVDFQTLLVAGRVGMGAAVKFRVWLDHYRHVEPIIDALVKEGKHPNVHDMSIDRQLVCAIAGSHVVAQMCRETPKDKVKHIANVQKVAKNVFGWLSKLPSEFQIGAAKSTLNMPMIQACELTKVPELMATFMQIRKALRD